MRKVNTNVSTVIEEIEKRTVVNNRITYMRPALTKGNSVCNKNTHQ